MINTALDDTFASTPDFHLGGGGGGGGADGLLHYQNTVKVLEPKPQLQYTNKRQKRNPDFLCLQKVSDRCF